MSQEQLEGHRTSIQIKNIGGIAETTVELSPGVTVLAGRNATNRTSLLQALMAALGSNKATLKGDAEEGHVELSVGDQKYVRRLRRQNGSISMEGEPFLDDAMLADLFAFLLESNEARRAIAQGNDLREIIMRPVDTAEIEADIDRLTDERQRVEERIDDLKSLKRELPDLEDRRNDLEDRVAEKRDELAEIEAKIEECDSDIDERREEQAELEEKLEELSSVRGELESVRRKLDSERESIESLEAEREALEEERETYAEVPDDRIEGITAEVRRLRDEIHTIDSTVDELQTVIQFNEGVLDGDVDLFGALHDGEEQGDVTDQLLEDGEDLACWTCGNEVDTSQIEAMIDRLSSLRNKKMEQRNALNTEIDELETERKELQEQRHRLNQIDDRLQRIDEEIADREADSRDLEERKREYAERIEKLEVTVEELRTDDQSELLELHKEANRLEVEIDRLEDDLNTVVDKIDQIEKKLEKRNQLGTRLDELQEETERLRKHVEQLEQQAVEEFNEHMDSILDILGYENIERIWIERTERKVQEGRRMVMKGHFDLHVVRTTESETVYEDTVEHLSESEREVTGLVFALAGYLTHQVYEELPFVLLDSVEALDSDRIASLIEYLETFTEYLVVALLEEDAAALDDGYHRVSEI